MTQVLLEFLVKFLAWAAPFTLRRLYPPQRIDELLKVRISADGDGIEFWGGELPKARAWITITNLSPFHVEIDRAYGTFAFGAELEKFAYLQKERILPASEKTMHIEASLTQEHNALIKRLLSSTPKPEVRFNAHILCRVHNFDIHRTLGTTHHRVVNIG